MFKNKKKQAELNARIKARKEAKRLEAINMAECAKLYNWSNHNSDVKGTK